MAKRVLSPNVGAHPPSCADSPGGEVPSVPPRRPFQEEMRARLEEDREFIGKMLKSDDLEPERETDPIDEIARLGRAQVNARVRRCLISKRDEIRRALEDMDLGIYGRCQECGEEIAPARLKAHPCARYCISCQEAEEKKNGQH